MALSFSHWKKLYSSSENIMCKDYFSWELLYPITTWSFIINWPYLEAQFTGEKSKLDWICLENPPGDSDTPLEVARGLFAPKKENINTNAFPVGNLKKQNHI